MYFAFVIFVAFVYMYLLHILYICFYFCSDFAVLEVEREDEFSPLKNAPGSGSNCPETARQDLINCHFRAIVKAGGKFVNADGSVVDHQGK